MAATITVRFNYIPETGTRSYRGWAEISEARDDNDDLLRTVDLLEVWEFDSIGYEEVYPYENGFDRTLCEELEQAAIEAVSNPPKYDVVLPSDWEMFQIVYSVTTHLVTSKIQLPSINTDEEAANGGFCAVKRINHLRNDRYMITGSSNISEVLCDLQKISVVSFL
jgi:hypothetical protein